MSSTSSLPLGFEGTARVSAREVSTLSMASAALVVLSGAAMALAATANVQRFAFTYFVGFLFLVTIGLGALFFVLLQHVTGSAWSLAPRRQMEWVAGVLVAAIPLFIPLVPLGHDVWHHWMSAEARADEALQAKAVWLNAPFFFARAFFYLSVWAGLSVHLYRKSRAHDESGDPRVMEGLRVLSAPAIIAFAVTTTFAAFDWVMSLDPHWYSTIFGVYVFSGSVVAALAVLSLLFMALERAGHYKKIFHVEHQHDIGKLLFGFTVFWAYIGFSQYLLIWYANIPEETEFYRHRLEGSWKLVSAALVVGHFIVPFLLLLSRHTKRNAVVLALGAVILLVMHGVDLFWLVMPTLDADGARFLLSDLGGYLFPLSIGAFAVLGRVRKSATFPVRDPRLGEAAQLENL